MKSMTYQFLDWLKSKPADATYNYFDTQNCAFCQFLREQGYAENPVVSSTGWGRHDGRGVIIESHNLPENIDRAVSDKAHATCRMADNNWTFGGAAKRLEALLTA